MHGLSLPTLLAGLLFHGSVHAQSDTVALLARHIEDGKVQVRFDDQLGYLPWILKELDIPVESRMLVFSKTSVQGARISPANPRTLYFNDSAIVGTVKGGSIEIAAQDPERGMAFYVADQNRFRFDQLRAKPKPASPFARRKDCMSCHVAKSTGFPKLLVRSVTTSSNGTPLLRFGAHETDGRTPFEQLWGGWYVTGGIEAKHLGNTVMSDEGKAVSIQPPGSSDIVALMVFEHQMHMMNLIAQARSVNNVDELVDYMLFVNEAPLPGRIESSGGFAGKFMARGPRDSKGRSLRDLDLSRRLMRYPCSYMIYSEAFDALPTTVKAAIYKRLWEVLDHRDAADRRAIVEILRDTKIDFPLAGKAWSPQPTRP